MADEQQPDALIRRLALLDDFACAGASCADTCCRGLTIAVDDRTLARYRDGAADFLSALEDAAVGKVMARDPGTDACVKFEHGLCAIQNARGAAYLCDHCYFYPRAARRLGDRIRMSACLSCPSIAEAALYGEAAPLYRERRVERLPQALHDVLPEGLTGRQAEELIEGFVALAGDPSTTPERAVVRTVSVARSLAHVEVARWPKAAPFLIDTVEERLAPPAPKPEDPHRLLLALAALAYATPHPMSERFEATLGAMEAALGVRLDRQTFALYGRPDGPDPDHAYPRLRILWQFARGALEAVLRRWLQAEIDSSGFPFAGLGNNLAERATILSLRFATLRLALMSRVALSGAPPERASVVRTVQSLARLLDHLADPALSLAIYREAGWHHESRLRGLLDDEPETEDRVRQEMPGAPEPLPVPAPQHAVRS